MAKLLAFHLPQYHSFKENDEWWGKGFTDWDNVKKAAPLYEGHRQPRVPLNGYYNMLDPNTHRIQAEQAKKYGIYGFCYYHYWFGGKMLMEKPMEMILNEPDIDMPYCMCWANEPWTRSWTGKQKEVIMPQTYGDQKDWLHHIRYLMPFFMDKRYVKVNSQPLFVIYRTDDVSCCDDMIECWDIECKKNGFSGIYIVEERNAFQAEPSCKNSKAVLNFEPGYTRNISNSFLSKTKKFIESKIGKNCHQISYPEEAELILNRPVEKRDKDEYLGAFVGWDNTPRRKVNGTVSVDCTPDVFQSFLEKQIERANSLNSEFVFINAWNEWAEGAYLEPDRDYGYAFLEAVRSAVDNQTQ